ncbi:membrane protein insertion efficiency factor YidD [Campylobacter mucosalis]|uniref:membrane protein insertion efficiency factor YidD n=1 Tax=Campylobacter mucosalis TaxID=202 RepID=UPI00146FEACE|nr:membrane protein insertion efficiency factor YidD [Campylobacter mucosalis]
MFKMRELLLSSLKFYQNYISKFTPSSCRYYPSCSEYAVWQFKNNNIFLAFFATFFRILKCNQLFKGGIDYPVVSKEFRLNFLTLQERSLDIKFWFIPCKKGKFYVIKAFASKEK